MENLNREAILRMLSGKTGNSSSGGGGGDIDLAGYATMIWVTENFVSIDFFRELFRAYDSNSQEIMPNDTTSVVNNIKAMVGTWTEEYLTALGNAGGGGGGGGGAQYLNDLLDVQLTTPLTDGQALVYNATLQKWVNGAAGVNMTTVWNALAGSTNEQINASHLSTALSVYVTTSDISDMATQTWVGQQGFATQTWVTSNFITIAYFDRLFRAYNGNTLVSHNDTTTTIDNIKAMFGFWTDFYLSALGTGGVSSVSISLSQLADVNVAGVTNGQVLSYNSTNAEWVPTTISNVTSLSALTDVALSSPTTYQVLMYDASTTKWYNSALKTINGQPLYGSGDISVGGGASGNYLPLSGGTVTGRTIFSKRGDADATSDGGAALIIGGTMSESHIEIDDNEIVAKANTSTGDGLYLQWDSGNLYLTRDANVGIGGGMPTYPNKLYVYGTIGASGSLNVNDIRSNPNNSATLNSRYGLLTICPSDWGGVNSNEWAVGSDAFNGVIRSASTLYIYRNGSRYTNIDNAGGIIYGRVVIELDNDAEASDYNSGSLRIGTSSGNHLLMDGNEIIAATGNSVGTLFLQYNGGTIECGGGSSITMNVTGNIVATGAVTALSDIRHKTVIRDAAVSVEDVARMPAVMYQWNDGREDKELHVGSIAQNWQTVLPEVVLRANDKEGTLSMQYGVAALVSSIIIARKVVSHEERIKQLEKENKELKKRLNIA